MTGCVVVSALCGVGERQVWKARYEGSDVTDAFEIIERYRLQRKSCPALKLVEKFVITIYDKSSAALC